MKLIQRISFIVIFTIISCHIRYGKCQKGRKGRDVMDDIQKTVHSISSSAANNEQKLATFEGNFVVVSHRLEKIIDTIEHNKLSHKLLDEKFVRLEAKIKTIEETMNNKINTVMENVERIGNEVTRIDSLNEGRLRKILNIVGDTYGLTKDVIFMLKGRSIGNGDNEGPDQMEEMQKKLLEQMSVSETSILQQLTNVAKISKETISALDNINLEMLNIRDECHSSRQSAQVDKDVDTSASVYPTIKTSRDTSSGHQCPNTTVLKNEIESQFERIGVKIENEMTIIESKIQDFMTTCNTNTNNSQSNGRSIPLSRDTLPPIGNTSTLMYTPSQKSINPAEKPIGHNQCQHSSPLLAPKSCSELLKSGANCDGVYIITIANIQMIRVYCDMSDNSGGWTVILRRGDFGRKHRKTHISFEQNWNSYKDGFGDMDSGEFWFGLENIHKLSTQEDQILQVDLESFDGEYVSIIYDSFRIGSEADNYRLHLGHPMQSNSTLAQSLIAHNTSMFSTHDRNNGISDDNCASKLRGGWWFNNCHSALLTAPYFKEHERRHVWQGIQWHSWKQWRHLKAAQMKIRSKF